MIGRDLEKVPRQLAAHYPALTVTGLRQSGKTTLYRAALKSGSRWELSRREMLERGGVSRNEVA